MLEFLVFFPLLSHGAWGTGPGRGGSPHGAPVDLPWEDELCCHVPTAYRATEGNLKTQSDAGAPNGSESPGHPPSAQCRYRGLKSTSSPSVNNETVESGGVCLSLLCSVDKEWEKVICDLKPRGPPSGPLDISSTLISLQRLVLQSEDDALKSADAEVGDPIVCTAGNSVMCSVTLDNTQLSVAVVTVAIFNATVPPFLLRLPIRPVKPSPPVNLTHTQTIEGQLLLNWNDPSQLTTRPESYEVRVSFNNTQVLHVSGEPRVSLDLTPTLNYTVQARYSLPGHPPLWSVWSKPHHVYLDTVSYVSEKAVVKPGENITVYCVFNDRSSNASDAIWSVNFNQIPDSQYRSVNRWVSQITVRSSKHRLYDMLQCTQDIPYSQVYVEGAAIAIKCETNGDIDAMTCSWENSHLAKLHFLSRMANVPCDEMESRERAGEWQEGERGQATCRPGGQGERVRICTNTIHPLGMNCYKLWLEVDSKLGPIRSRPIYVSPTDHVKPNTPSNVKAESQSQRVLRVTWKPPFFPVEGLQCQFRYHSPSTVSPQPEWKVQSPTEMPWAEVAVPDMCHVYAVQVRCMPVRGNGYWSDWSESVYSIPENSRAPENGPDFWRVLADEPHRNRTNVTLHLKHLSIEGQSYCVDGYVVQHQANGGRVVREKIGTMTPYSFEWNQEVHTVTVEAYNSLGSSATNIKMTLARQLKRRCVKMFHVTVINSTCVALSWSLLDKSSVPLSMVVLWSAQKQQHKDQRNSQSGETWARFPHTGHTQYLKGDFFASEKYGFTLIPVFSDGEGEPVYIIATRGDPAAYMLLMIITFLSIVLLVTLVLSQNQVKRFVLKDVPNPNNCSWASGVDFKKADTIDHLFRLPEALPAWPLLLPAESICEVVIVDKSNLPELTTAVVQLQDVSMAPTPAAGPASGLSGLQTAGSSAQSSVTYATVLLREPSEPLIQLSYKDGSGGGSGGGSSSSDDGNFSANNSDISGSFPGCLWELDDPRRSCSYNSVEEFSVTLEQEEDEGIKEDKDLYYLGMDPAEEDDREEEEEEADEQEGSEATKITLLKSVALGREDCSVESGVLLRPEEDLRMPKELVAPFGEGLSPLYLPQFKTVLCTRPVKVETQECIPPSVSFGTT